MYIFCSRLFAGKREVRQSKDSQGLNGSVVYHKMWTVFNENKSFQMIWKHQALVLPCEITLPR